MRYDKIDLRDHMWGMHHMAANLSAQNSLKYAHFPMHNMFTKNKFAKADKDAQLGTVVWVVNLLFACPSPYEQVLYCDSP